MRIYMDLVLILNFLVDFLLLLGTNRLAGYPPGWGRAAVAGMVGAGYAAACLIPGFYFLGNTLWRLVSFAAMAVIAFGWNRSAVQRGGVFILLSLALGGIATGAGQKNIPVLLLCGGLLWFLCNICFRGGLGRREYVPVELSWNGKKLRLIALRDTGNTLRDPVTGEQVLVAGADVGMELLGLTSHQLRHPVETLGSCALQGLRLIPYRGVGQPGSMMIGLRLEHVKVGNIYINPLVAFAPEEIAKGEVYRMLTGGAI